EPVAAAGGRTYVVALDGKVVIAGMTFVIAYEFAKGSSVLSGSWKREGTERFDWEKLAAALGIPAVGLELPGGLPDLELVDLAMRLDFDRSEFELSGESSGGDAGYFVAHKGRSW